MWTACFCDSPNRNLIWNTNGLILLTKLETYCLCGAVPWWKIFWMLSPCRGCGLWKSCGAVDEFDHGIELYRACIDVWYEENSTWILLRCSWNANFIAQISKDFLWTGFWAKKKTSSDTTRMFCLIKRYKQTDINSRKVTVAHSFEWGQKLIGWRISMTYRQSCP